MPPLNQTKRNQIQLRFSPTAWAKLLYLRDYGKTEVGGFGITRSDDLLYVEDVVLVKQCCSSISTKFDDAAVADFFDEQVDAGRQPAQFARVWIHTHPEMSAHPSRVDEATFRAAFGRTDWAVMFILSKTEDTSCRLQFNVGPGGSLEIPVCVDYSGKWDSPFQEGWELEYLLNVTVDDHWGGWPDRKSASRETKPKEAAAAVQETIAKTVKYLRKHYSEDDINGSLKRNKCTIEELAGWYLEQNPDTAPDQEQPPAESDLRERLLDQYGYLDSEIDCLLCDYTLEDLVQHEEDREERDCEFVDEPSWLDVQP